jgi:hypothetical protein
MDRINAPRLNSEFPVKLSKQTGLVAYFQGKGHLAIDFCLYLIETNLKASSDTALLFLHGGAQPLHGLTKHLARPEYYERIFGVNLPGDYIRQRANHPKIVAALNETKVLNWERIVLVDTGFKGRTAAQVIDLLNDTRLLDYTGQPLSRNNWSTVVVLLCLRGRNRQAAEYNIQGYNDICGQSRDRVFEDVAFLIEEGVMPGKKISEVIPFSRDEITQALIQAAGPVPF